MIVHVLGNMTAGGNERLCLELVRRGPPNVGRALITIDPVPAGPLKRLFESIPDLQIFCEPYHRNARLRFVLGMAKRLRQLRPEGIITYPFGLHLLIALAARAVPGCRFISHVGNPPPPHGPRRAVFEHIVYASRLLGTPMWSCSETVHEQFEKLGLGMPKDSRPMPNGVNIEALREAAERGRSTRPAGGPTITMTARLDAIKDHDTLLRAFALVRRQLPTARLLLAGEGDRKEALEHLSSELGLGQSISFLGVRSSVGELLGQVDLFVFSTTAAEGFGIALAEAMAVGLPVVASNVPACREVLNGGECGILVPPRDVTAMADAMLTLLRDPALAKSYAAKAAQRVSAEYDIRACAQHYYDYLLNARTA